jgi:carboxymethylenebutenolidase
MSIQKSTIQLKVNNENFNAYLACPEKGGPGILVLHAWWGLKPFFKELCDRLARQGFIAIAPDLRKGLIANTIDEAKILMQNSDGQYVGDTVMSAKDYLLSLPNRKGEKIGVIGFSMGAAWSLVVAMREPDKIAATILFYGTGSVDINKIKSKIMGHYSDNDEWEPMEGIRAMETGMKAVGVDVTFHIYPKVGHWFVEDDRPEYDPAAAKLAWERTFELLNKNLY